MQVNEAVGKLVSLFLQEQAISNQVKSIKDELKEAGYNPSLVVAVAKSVASGKVAELQEKSEETIKIIESISKEDA